MKFNATTVSKDLKFDFEDSCNDHSNPQQHGTGGSNKMATQENQDNRENKKFGKINIKPSSKKKVIRKLFVGGLPSDITEREFRVFFEQYGLLIDSVVMFDKETRRSRGFGFVTFQDPDVAARLLVSGRKANQKNLAQEPCTGRLVMRGKTCEIKAAEPKGARQTRRQHVRENTLGSTNNDCHFDHHGQRRFKMNESNLYRNGTSMLGAIPVMDGGSQFPFFTQDLPWNAHAMIPSFYAPQYGFNTVAMYQTMMPAAVPYNESPAAYQIGGTAPLVGPHIDGSSVFNMNTPHVEINTLPHQSNYDIMPMPYLFTPHFQPHPLPQQYSHTNNPASNQPPMVLVQQNPHLISSNEEKTSTNEIT